MIIRPFQGGFTYRKLVYWGRALNRYRIQAIIALCLVSFPIKVHLGSILAYFSFWAFFFYTAILRPPQSKLPNKPLEVMNSHNAVSFLPPSRNYPKKSFDVADVHSLYVDNEKYLRFQTFNEVDVVRTRCLFAHPSRETNGVVEGELLRNEQDKIVDSMKVMMAEFGVSKGIWKSVGDAFLYGDQIEKRRNREIMKGLDKLF